MFYFSFGSSCIFLIGGPTKETEPVPLFLHSGDICLMTGKARLSYHAVPRILPGKKQHLRSCFYGDGETNSETSVNQTEVDNKNDSFSAKDDSDVEDDPYSGGTNQKPPSINIVQSEMTGSDENVIVTPTVKGNNCSVKELGNLMQTVIESTNWEPFDKYMEKSRINVNVRQVLKQGLSLGVCPEKITPCQRSCQNT